MAPRTDLKEYVMRRTIRLAVGLSLVAAAAGLNAVLWVHGDFAHPLRWECYPLLIGCWSCAYLGGWHTARVLWP